MAGAYNRECFGCSLGNESLNLMNCYSCKLSQLYDALRGGGLFVAKPAT